MTKEMQRGWLLSAPCDRYATPRVQEWQAERLTATGATTVAKSYRLLKAILETATDDELIRRNPCRIRGAGKEVSQSGQVATVAQVDALADAIGIRWRLMVYLGAYGPMRPEEQAELRRKDVDVDNVTVVVRKAAPELATGGARRLWGISPRFCAGAGDGKWDGSHLCCRRSGGADVRPRRLR